MFCRIYVTGKDINRESLLASVCNLLQAELVDDVYIEGNGYSMEVRANDDYDEEKEKVFPDGFLFFPFCVEIEFQDNVLIDDIVKHVSEILTFLWGNNFTAIASCDFEHLLPENGGYKSRKIPWVEMK
jgi:hypothetical protein